MIPRSCYVALPHSPKSGSLVGGQTATYTATSTPGRSPTQSLPLGGSEIRSPNTNSPSVLGQHGMHAGGRKSDASPLRVSNPLHALPQLQEPLLATPHRDAVKAVLSHNSSSKGAYLGDASSFSEGGCIPQRGDYSRGPSGHFANMYHMPPEAIPSNSLMAMPSENLPHHTSSRLLLTQRSATSALLSREVGRRGTFDVATPEGSILEGSVCNMPAATPLATDINGTEAGRRLQNILITSQDPKAAPVRLNLHLSKNLRDSGADASHACHASPRSELESCTREGGSGVLFTAGSPPPVPGMSPRGASPGAHLALQRLA